MRNHCFGLSCLSLGICKDIKPEIECLMVLDGVKS